MATKSKGKKKSSSKPKAASKAEMIEESSAAKRQVISVLLFTFSAFLFLAAIIKGESGWLVIHNCILGIFGFFGYSTGLRQLFKICQHRVGRKICVNRLFRGVYRIPSLLHIQKSRCRDNMRTAYLPCGNADDRHNAHSAVQSCEQACKAY